MRRATSQLNGVHARNSVLVLALLLAFSFSIEIANAQTKSRSSNAKPTVIVPAPEDVLGFRPGAERRLASWSQTIDYFTRLSAKSDRVKFEELGKSTMGAPFVIATISDPENLKRLDELKAINQKLADPRKPGARDNMEARELIARGKAIVLITCGIHSTEVGSYLSSMLIAYRLASSREPQVRSILRNCVILLVPSLNPDGVDIVKRWYDKTLGTPYEGTNPPELYHKYAGHDDNRDWYAFTQVETQITVEKVHNAWHPQIVLDIHQQGEFGSRLFLPPYMAPVEPNVPSQIVDGYTELGLAMVKEMRSAGFRGITTDSTYDAWTPGRAYSHYHGGVRILSETASARLASPVTIHFSALRAGEGYDPRKPAPNFPDVWKGGEWHLRNITNYMTAAAFALLRNAAENRKGWLMRFYSIGKDAVRARKTGELVGLRFDGSTPSGRELRRVLEIAGVEVTETSNGELIRMDQPYAGFAKAMLEVQKYPDLFDKNGNPIPPYDVTAHSLSLLYGVGITPLFAPLNSKLFTTGSSKLMTTGPAGAESGPCTRTLERNAIYKSHVPSIDEGWTRWVLEKERVRQCITYSSLQDAEARTGNLRAKYDVIIIPDQAPGTILNGYKSGSMPAELTGGLGREGVNSLHEFVEQGGTLICLNRASDFAVEQLRLPVHDITAGLNRTQFYAPGSILRTEIDTSQPVSMGMPKDSIAWVEDSPAFEVIPSGASRVRVIARYPKTSSPLLSGWMLGGDRIKGKAALLDVSLGRGHVYLFGFRPQYRGQSMATYPLLFNAIQQASIGSQEH